MALDFIYDRMILYAKEAIKEDRLNIAEHAKTKRIIVDAQAMQLPTYGDIIDKNSIIHTPNIELK